MKVNYLLHGGNLFDEENMFLETKKQYNAVHLKEKIH